MAVAYALYPGNGQPDRNLWVVGTAGADAYPTNGFGGGTATATSSLLMSSTGVYLVGILVHVAAAAVVAVCDHDGTAIPGTSFTLASSANTGFIPLGLYFKATGTGASNVGIKCGAGITASLLYRA